jgi:hypothetical protein
MMISYGKVKVEKEKKAFDQLFETFELVAHGE